ncbi:MAG: sulfate adenylyltransferase [candidate division WOR-3 bacterium]
MELVNLKIEEEEKEKILEEAIKEKKIEIDEDALFDLEKIAIGAFSPLKGFMNEEEVLSVIERMRLPNGFPWTIPVILQIKKEDFEKVENGERVFLKFNDEIYGFIYVKDKYKINLDYLCKKIFDTKDEKHPGVWNFKRKGEFVIGGEIRLIKKPSHPFKSYEYEPSETRKIFKERGWKTVCAFQTRNAPHRGHEYLQKLALEITDGLFIQPILGRKKEGDFSNDTILKSYEVLIKNYFPEKRVFLSGLSTWMRYAGPREAVFHAIVRKNYGATHFIVGRDHAGVGNYYHPYAAHEIFENFPDLGIEIIKVYSVFYCKKCDAIVSEKVCNHSKEYTENISMTRIRNIIKNNETPDEKILRKEVFEVLKEELLK